jgi:hypothetical protein
MSHLIVEKMYPAQFDPRLCQKEPWVSCLQPMGVLFSAITLRNSSPKDKALIEWMYSAPLMDENPVLSRNLTIYFCKLC